MEIGEKVHYRSRTGGRQEKLESRWAESFYLGKVWRTGEARFAELEDIDVGMHIDVGMQKGCSVFVDSHGSGTQTKMIHPKI